MHVRGRPRSSVTDRYRTLTRRVQPVVDALAELLVRDMIELSEEHMGA